MVVESLSDVHNYGDRFQKAPRNTVYQGSAESLLWRLPKGSIEIFWFSPPYNLDDRFRGGDSGKTGIKTQYDTPQAYHGDGTGLPEMVYQAQQQLVLTLASEAMKSGGVMFYSHKVRLKGGRSISPREWIDRTGLVVIQEVIWDRGSTAQGDPRRLHPVYETIYILAKKLAIKTKYDSPFLLNNPGKRSGGPGYSDVWSLSPKTYGVSRRESGHPAVSPAEIVRRCLQVSPFASGLVCDPYCGTGTTGKVAVEMGFEYLLSDVSMRWAAQAELSIQTASLDTGEPVFCGEGDA